MVTTIAKWGDSLAVRLPQHLIGELQFAEGVEVDLVVVDGWPACGEAEDSGWLFFRGFGCGDYARKLSC
jgi:hypothetical protein